MPLRTEILWLRTSRILSWWYRLPHSSRCQATPWLHTNIFHRLSIFTKCSRINEQNIFVYIPHTRHIPFSRNRSSTLRISFWNYVLHELLVRLKTGDRLIAMPLPTHNTNTEEIIIYFHASGRTRTHDKRVRVSEESNRVIPRGLCDRPSIILL